MKYAPVIFLILFYACVLTASPASDLSSPSPEIRAVAAQTLRSSYQPPPQSKWASLLAVLKVGDMMTNIAAILRAGGIKQGYGGGSQTLVTEYRLDEYWLLKCYCLNRLQPEKRVMYDRHLEPGPSFVSVPAPTNFTGVWIEYYINGRTCFETNMKGGVRCGDRTCYSPDGNKAYVEYYEPNSSEVGRTEFYHSGSVKTMGKLARTGAPIGTWTNYNEQDGTIVSTRRY